MNSSITNGPHGVLSDGAWGVASVRRDQVRGLWPGVSGGLYWLVGFGRVEHMFDTSTAVGSDPAELLAARVERTAAELARAQAEQYAAVWALADAACDVPGVMDEFAPAEVALALMLTRRAADTLVDYAHAICVEWPDIRQALYDGAIDDRRARLMVDGIRNLPPGEASKVLDAVLPVASGLTTGQLRHRIRRRAAEADPVAQKQRYEAGLAERRVVLDGNDDGTANFHAFNLPAHRAAALMAKVTHNANRLPRDDRTADQRRADVFVDLLDGQPGTTQQAVADVSVELTTLIGLDDRPGEIPGWGPITADLARRVVVDNPQSLWNITVTDGGEPVWVGTTRRRPNIRQQRATAARSRHCVFPGCRMPARHSDIDHAMPWAENRRTHVSNLQPLCRYHHRLKTEAGWTVAANGTDYLWTSRLGQARTVSARGP